MIIASRTCLQYDESCSVGMLLVASFRWTILAKWSSPKRNSVRAYNFVYFPTLIIFSAL